MNLTKAKSHYFAFQSTFLMKRSSLQTALAFVLLAGLLSSCRIFNPSVMLRTKRDYPYVAGQDTVPSDYIIQKGDLVNFRLFSNQGFKIIDLSTIDEGRSQLGSNSQNTLNYLIEADSSINLPIISRVKIAGMNLKEAELYLEDKYSNYYNDPFVRLEVNNRRITVFPGTGGTARVIPITNEYVTIIEALALAGGITEGGKAHKIKVVRGSLNDPVIYRLDLSTPEGLDEANLYYVKANDIIYVEPSYFAGRQVLNTTGQFLGVITSAMQAVLIAIVFNNALTTQ